MTNKNRKINAKDAKDKIAWSAKFILLGVQNLFCLECKIYFAFVPQMER